MKKDKLIGKVTGFFSFGVQSTCSPECVHVTIAEEGLYRNILREFLTLKISYKVTTQFIIMLHTTSKLKKLSHSPNCDALPPKKEKYWGKNFDSSLRCVAFDRQN